MEQKDKPDRKMKILNVSEGSYWLLDSNFGTSKPQQMLTLHEETRAPNMTLT